MDKKEIQRHIGRAVDKLNEKYTSVKLKNIEYVIIEADVFDKTMDILTVCKNAR